MTTNVDDIASLGKATEDGKELKDNYEDVIPKDLGNNDEKTDLVDVDNIESSSGSDDIDLTGIHVNYFFLKEPKVLKPTLEFLFLFQIEKHNYDYFSAKLLKTF